MKEKVDPVGPEDRVAREEFENLSAGEKQKEFARLHEEALLRHTLNFHEKAKAETDPKQKESLMRALDIAESVKAEGGMGLVVGGYARDEALRRFGYNIVPKDIDFEIYGISFEKLKKILSRFGKVNIVGEQFGVFKIGDLDISIPRRDSKTGKGHKGFAVESDPEMTIRAAARRRDFTMNALGLDPLTGEIVDKYGGLKDIQEKILRAVDSETFDEDPLRVLRAMQFAGRFGFSVAPETVELCKHIDFSELPKERIGEEWSKLLLKSPKPSVGMEVARELGVIEKLHPELHALIGVPQDKEHHPEGDAWAHTLLAVDAAAEIAEKENVGEENAKVLLFGALCHDLGKPLATQLHEDGKITSHGHAEAGVEPAKKLLASLNVSKAIVEKVLPLVEEHMFPLTNPEPSPAAVRRLARRLHPATIGELVLVSKADKGGRGILYKRFLESEALLRIAEALEIKEAKPTPLVDGRDLILLGMKPSKHFGEILNELLEAQLEGKFRTKEEGIAYFHAHIKKSP